MCGASLIDEVFAVTAAHCITLKDKPTPQFDRNLEISAVGGEVNIEWSLPVKQFLKVGSAMLNKIIINR